MTSTLIKTTAVREATDKASWPTCSSAENWLRDCRVNNTSDQSVLLCPCYSQISNNHYLSSRVSLHHSVSSFFKHSASFQLCSFTLWVHHRHWCDNILSTSWGHPHRVRSPLDPHDTIVDKGHSLTSVLDDQESQRRSSDDHLLRCGGEYC